MEETPEKAIKYKTAFKTPTTMGYSRRGLLGEMGKHEAISNYVDGCIYIEKIS